MPRRSKKRIILNGFALLAAAALVYQWWTGSPPTAPVTQVDIGGSYATLTAAQRRLVDDWVARYDTATGRSAVPAEVYDGLALSTKTTLNAVTHALSLTLLTDDAGRSMNLTALDLIAKVDANTARPVRIGLHDVGFPAHPRPVPPLHFGLSDAEIGEPDGGRR